MTTAPSLNSAARRNSPPTEFGAITDADIDFDFGLHRHRMRLALSQPQ